MTNEVKVLSDDALREIETRREARDVVWYHIPLTPTERDALCATVRALRVENRSLRERLDNPPLIDPWKGDYDRD